MADSFITNWGPPETYNTPTPQLPYWINKCIHMHGRIHTMSCWVMHLEMCCFSTLVLQCRLATKGCIPAWLQPHIHPGSSKEGCGSVCHGWGAWFARFLPDIPRTGTGLSRWAAPYRAPRSHACSLCTWTRAPLKNTGQVTTSEEVMRS